MQWTVVVTASFFILCIQVQGQKAQSVTRLGYYNVNRDLITVSGFSSGGTFAQQFFFSYPSLIHGIGVFSHAYYRCGPATGIQADYDNACTTLGRNLTHSQQEYDFQNVFRDIEDYHSRGLIENPRNLNNKRLYVFAGTRNWLFTTETSLRAPKIFQPYIANERSIRTVVQEANLTLPTNRADYPLCISPPNRLFLSNCDYSGALNAIQFLLEDRFFIRAPSAADINYRTRYIQPLIHFDQTEFFHGIDPSNNGRHDMDNVGFMYVPEICQGGHTQCLLHFYFHGCSVGKEFVGTEHIRNSGYLEVAEANGIIMVFPQVKSSPENDIGCWDTYGFTGPLYATQSGAQVTVVRNMLAKFLSTTPSSKHLPGSQQPEFYPQQKTLPEPPDFVSRFFKQNEKVFKFLASFRN